ncbi:hypothetical protein ACFLU8_00335 [Chloroflexota bacterium]
MDISRHSINGILYRPSPIPPSPNSQPLLANDDAFFVIEVENREIAAFAELEGSESTDYDTAVANYAWKALLGHLKAGGFA